MIDEHLATSLKNGGILANNARVIELTKKETSFTGLSELSYDCPGNEAFYCAAYPLMDNIEKKIVFDSKRRIGGFNLYPINFNSNLFMPRPRVFSGRYRMGFVNFELACTMLPKGTLDKLSQLYRFIRNDISNEVDNNLEDSTLVLHRTTWEPPHFHLQNTQNEAQWSVSYAVKIHAPHDCSSRFDFFSDQFSVFETKENTLTKIYFQGKFIHQVFKTNINDLNQYFFFVWDGCVFKKMKFHDENIYVQRYTYT